MYTEFFGLNEKPFSITPDPRYLYLSRRHADALAHLIYGISESGGFIQLTGEVGTGKTTLIRTLLQQLPNEAEIALILNPQLSAKEFLQSICDELGAPVEDDSSVRTVIAALNAYLLEAHAAGRRVVLIVDEAQTLGPELLEQVRLLTNLETATQKLLQIILIGQPELRDVLRRPGMRQIAQRITGRYHLEPLGKAEAEAYVDHRLRVAGCQRPIFEHGGVAELYRRSAGIPRLINVVADRALLAAYSRDRTRVDRGLVKQAAAEVFGKPVRSFARRWGIAAVCLAAAGLAAAGLVQHFGHLASAEAAVAAKPAAAEDKPAAAVPKTVAALDAQDRPRSSAATRPSGLLDLLADPGLPKSNADAFAALFALWGAHYDATRGDPCAQAAEQQLQCMSRQHSSLGELRTIDRPAVLSLRDSAGQSRSVLLAALGYDDAELLVGGRRIRIGIPALTHAWYGEQTLLWRPPLKRGKALTPGTRSPEVVWLRRSLARIRGESLAGKPSTLYDPKLEAEVRQYQRKRMLSVDGIVGARTQIAMLTDLGGGDAPSLHED
ncbi:MAG TPA: AAA family ATPase [Gammaproteobacteria bacterium]|nr:AAA family ATPase [Gammaproteobacteria bacterium]